MTKKMHRILAEAVVETLERIFEEGAVADRAVGRVLGQHPKWGKRDRSFVAESVYEAVRWRRRLEVLADSRELWPLCGRMWESQGYVRPDWADWPEASEREIGEREQRLELMPRAVRCSLSDEFDRIGETELGGRWESELAALNQAAPVYLRVNPRRGHVEAVTAELAAAGVNVEPVPGAPLALRVLDGKAVPAGLRESGRFEIQDAGSQQVAPFCQVGPGMKVVDACAGAGGKTLHLAALLGADGDLLAMDVEERKLETLKTRAARATVRVRTAVAADAVVEKWQDRADRVLVDAPCSGSGTLRRQADLKYRITAAGLKDVRETQRSVLARYAAMVRPGGKLVYATCSVLPSENEEQAAWFSEARPDFRFEEERRIDPSPTGWDGFYMARWRRGE